MSLSAAGNHSCAAPPEEGQRPARCPAKAPEGYAVVPHFPLAVPSACGTFRLRYLLRSSTSLRARKYLSACGTSRLRYLSACGTCPLAVLAACSTSRARYFAACSTSLLAVLRCLQYFAACGTCLRCASTSLSCVAQVLAACSTSLSCVAQVLPACSTSRLRYLLLAVLAT